MKSLFIKNHCVKYIILILIGVSLTISCQEKKNAYSIQRADIFAWCIVPFDSLERSPEERIEMLKRLDINKYAYDWRAKHLPDMAKELRLAKQNGIEVIAVWMWIDEQWDAVGDLNDSNEKVFEVVEEVGYNGQVWVSFHANFFNGLSDREAVEKGAKMIAYLSEKANALGCKIALYNHGDWFGEPENQIKIIEALPNKDLGLVYNFHHAHQQIDAFPELVNMMMPHLWYVNLNGLRKEGPKILTIGKGNHEMEMIDLLIEKGYKGDFGVLGHVEEADVEVILQANLEGLEGKISE